MHTVCVSCHAIPERHFEVTYLEDSVGILRRGPAAVDAGLDR
jgi:hypothetical protein